MGLFEFRPPLCEATGLVRRPGSVAAVVDGIGDEVDFQGHLLANVGDLGDAGDLQVEIAALNVSRGFP